MKTIKLTSLCLLMLIALIMANFISEKNPKPDIVISMQDSALNFNASFLEYVIFGHNRLVADTIWFLTLLDSDLEHYRSETLNNWMYIRFDTIAKLDPNFLENYIHGGQYLGVVKDDVLAAKDIFERGLLVYPTNYYLNLYGGYNDLIDLKDFKSAYQKLNLIKYYPQAPTYLPSVVAKLKVGMGQLESSYEIIKEAYLKSPKDSPMQAMYFTHLNRLKIDIDLECLNAGKKNCSSEDHLGNKYILKDKKYVYPFEYSKFKFNKVGIP